MRYICGLLLLGMTFPVAAVEDGTFLWGQPYLRDGIAMVAVRDICRMFGASLMLPHGDQATIEGAGGVISVGVGQAKILRNGRLYDMRGKPELVRGTMMVPLQPLVQALGGKAEYVPAERAVHIHCRGKVYCAALTEPPSSRTLSAADIRAVRRALRLPEGAELVADGPGTGRREVYRGWALVRIRGGPKPGPVLVRQTSRGWRRGADVPRRLRAGEKGVPEAVARHFGVLSIHGAEP